MAVVPKPRAKGRIVFGVTNLWLGRPTWELVGPNRDEAEKRDRAMKREIANKTYVPKQQQIGTTVQQYLDYWGTTRTNASAEDERRHLRLYVEPAKWFAAMRIDEVEPMHVIRLVEELKGKKKPDGSKRLTDKTIANAMGTLRVMFETARLTKLCSKNPVDLPKKMLRRSATKVKDVYQLSECAVLIRHSSIPWPIRVLNALVLLTGMREGEACGRKWKDLDDAPQPLASLSVHDQYGGKPLKGGEERPRMVPVHPELNAVLVAWATEGFELYTGSPPKPDDYIVPNVSRRSTHAHHTRSSYYKQFIKYAELAGVPPRSLHATRHSFISHCRRAGANKDALERVTHNAVGDIVDRYTHWDWAPLCEAVLCLNLDARPESGPTPKLSGGNGGGFLGNINKNHRGSSSQLNTAQGSIPGASTQKTLVLQGARKTRQEKRQDSDSLSEDLRAANRDRKRKLLTLSEVDPDGAAPGLAICRALDAVYDGDLDEAADRLATVAKGAA